ncbi:uncharacterized protein LOC142355774 [Convolutriloba macropyga]|uniref:uncharacterized protein LOC142355774 n=1 Tax=Convolutriloba macropyga TaxID=536237 RepID=UPI003F51F3C8
MKFLVCQLILFLSLFLSLSSAGGTLKILDLAQRQYYNQSLSSSGRVSRGILDHDMGGKECHEENDKCHFHGDCCQGLACKYTYEGVCLPHNGETIFSFLGKVYDNIFD